MTTRPPGSFVLHASLFAAVSLLAACGGADGVAQAGAPTAAPAEGTQSALSASDATLPVLPSQLSPLNDVAAVPTETETPEHDNARSHALGLSVLVPQQDTARRAQDIAPMGSGAIYYVNSQTGNDSNNGRAESGTGGVGPWKSLDKVAMISFAPGDVIRLACGSVWTRTLALSSSGTVDMPITVAAYPAGCAKPPVIDGSVAIAPASWTLHAGNIYRTPLTFAPKQLKSSIGQMDPAHHPNRGFDSTQPNSLYLRIAANSDNVVKDGKATSTYLTTGTDLKLPLGASIPAGTIIRMRPKSWVVDESVISAVSGSKLSLATPPSYPLTAGWGYFLLGQFWMLDSPGEWHYDPAGKYLYAWMPDSKAPTTTLSVSTLAVGIDLGYKKYVAIDGLSIRMVGKGVNMQRSTGVSIRNSVVEDTVDIGIDAAGSISAVVESNTVSRTGSDAISGVDDNVGLRATGMRIARNRVGNSGVIISGDIPVSLPRRSYGAIRSGENAQVTGNTVLDAGYVGIYPLKGSTVDGNYVSGACSTIDDCAGIYVWGTNNASTISNNIVSHSRGAAEGKPAANTYTLAKGIYLDEGSNGVQVVGNTVFDTDDGIHLHSAANSVVKNNTFYGNRKTQIQLQESSNKVNPNGDVFGNTVLNNQIVVTSPAAAGIVQTTAILNTLSFATYDGNKYFDSVYPTIATERTPSKSSSYNLLPWKAATTDTGSPRYLDPNGSGTSQLKYATSKSTGGNIVPNGDLAAGLTGWTSWNSTAPYGTLVRESCTPGSCATYTAGASLGVFSTPVFSVVQGQWYRISLDMKSGAVDQKQALVLRSSGGAAGTGSISNVGISATIGSTWKRYSFVIQATKTVNVNDPATGGKGARIDFDKVNPGTKVSVGSIEMVPITSVSATTRTDLLVNGSASPVQMACPVAVATPALCSNYVKLSDTSSIVWPYSLPALSTVVVYTLDRTLVDADGDGVPDVQDMCPNTTTGNGVNAAGCELGR